MKYLFIVLSILFFSPNFAQNNEDKKDKKEKKEKKPKDDGKFLYKDATIETDDYKLYIIDAVALAPYSKFKIKVFNKTNDYLIVKPSEFIYKSEKNTLSNTEKSFVVAPNDEGSRVVDFKGKEMQVAKYEVEIKGIYKASANGKIIDVPNFDLPPAKNDFTIGDFTCILKKHDANTDKATAKFECTYNGDNIGIISPYKSACIMPNGTENANAKKSNGILLEKGKNDDFTLVFNEIPGAGDLQKKTIKVKWNDTFKESKLVRLSDSKIELEKDLEKK